MATQCNPIFPRSRAVQIFGPRVWLLIMQIPVLVRVMFRKASPRMVRAVIRQFEAYGSTLKSRDDIAVWNTIQREVFEAIASNPHTSESIRFSLLIKSYHRRPSEAPRFA